MPAEDILLHRFYKHCESKNFLCKQITNNSLVQQYQIGKMYIKVCKKKKFIKANPIMPRDWRLPALWGPNQGPTLPLSVR